MKALLLFQQMLVLFAMMMTGFLAYRLGWVDRHGGQKVTTLVVKVFNPLMILSSVTGKRSGDAGSLMGQNLLLAMLYFVFVILCGYLYCFIRKLPRKDGNMYLLLTSFSNLGFMGIPVVRAVFGPEYIIFIVFYLLIFNILVYTYGIFLAMGMSDKKHSFSAKSLLNTGMAACLVSVILFFFQIQVPDPVVTFCSYMGDTAVPLSMIVIGISLAQSSFSDLFRKRETWIYLLFKMILVPVAGVLLFRLLPVNTEVFSIFTLMVSMPCAAIAGMFSQEYAGRGDEANRIILLTTVLSVITIPLISLI